LYVFLTDLSSSSESTSDSHHILELICYDTENYTPALLRL
jgi:hypothetical protein